MQSTSSSSSSASSSSSSSSKTTGYLNPDVNLETGSQLEPLSLFKALNQRVTNSNRSPRPSKEATEQEEDYDDDVEDSSSDFSSTLYDDDDEYDRLAQEEWDEGVRQLELAFKVMLLPFVGKWLGRKSSYWAFERFKRHGGLNLAFFGLSNLNFPSLLPSPLVSLFQA
ncbi:hypothetical protein IE53DRAFT_379974 [Violaceomyces palustris]|uniref:Uncharacterized protein n=1 Tax=Violaceomyces palustris TaxID=1673888 RepID=A0ACD0NWH1_9BASI|nr:hypothetical protein IE53DRAFT_379974 [Violaceomyces palustris]